jgi:hypothetical protein
VLLSPAEKTEVVSSLRRRRFVYPDAAEQANEAAAVWQSLLANIPLGEWSVGNSVIL